MKNKVSYWVVPGFIGRGEREVMLWEVEAAVCEYYGIGREELLGREEGVKGRKERVHPTQVIMYLMEKHGNMKMREMAAYFGYPYRGAVSMAVTAVERRLERKDMDTIDAVAFAEDRLFGFGSCAGV